jgi:hypothetical protein
MVTPVTPDWRRLVRERLPPLRLPPAREAEIVEELALQLEQDYRDAAAAGASPEEAGARALARVPPWEALAAESEEAAAPAGAERLARRRQRPYFPRS